VRLLQKISLASDGLAKKIDEMRLETATDFIKEGKEQSMALESCPIG
jgi:hypothetical protein